MIYREIPFTLTKNSRLVIRFNAIGLSEISEKGSGRAVDQFGRHACQFRQGSPIAFGLRK